MNFINRTNELADLEKRWKSGKPELFIVYGKRRVGKTELVKKFIQGKPAIYFLADKRTMIDQLREVSRLVGEAFGDPLIEKQGFGDWLEVFRYLQRNSKKRCILVVDEFPYLAEVDSAASSVFQKGWDEYLRAQQSMLILMGSSIAMMESETLIQKAPLFGRRTGQLLLQPLSFSQSWQFFPKMSFVDFLEFYAVVGGMPAYLMQMEGLLSAEENLVAHVLPKTEFLYNEIEFVLKEELREPKNYLSILRAISFGKRKLGEIVNETGIDRTLVNKYLHTLAQLLIVERELPVTEKNPVKSRKGLYRLCDNFFRFWFQYVFPYKSDLEIGRHNEVLRKFREQFNMLTAIAYEEVCRELAPTWQDQLFPFERVGKWWDKNEEIDVVAINQRENQILLGECKWSEKPVGTNIYESLKKKAQLVDWGLEGREERYILFSKSGFTADMKKIAREEKVLLVEKDRLMV
ncbi:ATP-binding protein [Candidatus Uhrbacteria bacterium]|nr:ATP-binding protein [Candidatus Uhrbacteria bacterium]